MAANSGLPGDSSPQIQMKVVESWAGNEVNKTKYLECSQDITVARAHYVCTDFRAKCRSL